MFFFSFIFHLFLFYPKHVYEQSYTHFLCFFFLFLVYDYLMVSVTSTLPFRDHFTITTTTTTTMTTPPTKPPPPPPRAQTRPPPFWEQTGLETQLRLESQVYFFSFLFCFFFFITNTFIYSVYGMRATTR